MDTLPSRSTWGGKTFQVLHMEFWQNQLWEKTKTICSTALRKDLFQISVDMGVYLDESMTPHNMIWGLYIINSKQNYNLEVHQPMWKSAGINTHNGSHVPQIKSVMMNTEEKKTISLLKTTASSMRKCHPCKYVFTKMSIQLPNLNYAFVTLSMISRSSEAQCLIHHQNALQI